MHSDLGARNHTFMILYSDVNKDLAYVPAGFVARTDAQRNHSLSDTVILFCVFYLKYYENFISGSGKDKAPSCAW